MNGYQPDFWHWWILALALIIAETLLPGTFFLWMGVSALVLGVLAWLIPTMGWEIQLMLFAVLSLVSIVGWRMWQRKNPDESDHPNAEPPCASSTSTGCSCWSSRSRTDSARSGWVTACGGSGVRMPPPVHGCG